MYASEGAFTYGDVMDMTVADRNWFMIRLERQKQEEKKKADAEKAKVKGKRK